MRFAIGIKQKKWGVVFILIITALTFFLPKETFDPHLGIDVDIFCKSMTDFGSDAAGADLFYNEFKTSIIPLIVRGAIISTIVPKRISIRAPPHTQH